MGLSGAATCMTFMEREVFADLQLEPWSLMQGVISANLGELRFRAPTAITDEIADKIRKLQQCGSEHCALVGAVSSYREA